MGAGPYASHSFPNLIIQATLGDTCPLTKISNRPLASVLCDHFLPVCSWASLFFNSSVLHCAGRPVKVQRLIGDDFFSAVVFFFQRTQLGIYIFISRFQAFFALGKVFPVSNCFEPNTQGYTSG